LGRRRAGVSNKTKKEERKRERKKKGGNDREGVIKQKVAKPSFCPGDGKKPTAAMKNAGKKAKIVGRRQPPGEPCGKRTSP